MNGRATSEVRAPIAVVESSVTSPVRMQPPTAALTPQTKTPHSKRSAEDFIFGKVIGDGCYSTVFLAKDIHTGKEYASKNKTYCLINI